MFIRIALLAGAAITLTGCAYSHDFRHHHHPHHTWGDHRPSYDYMYRDYSFINTHPGHHHHYGHDPVLMSDHLDMHMDEEEGY